jgi:hypothetical protein
MKHVLAAAAIAVLVCLASGCEDATGSDSRPVSTVAIAGDSAELAVGGTRQMTAVPLAMDGDTLRDREVVWSSSDSTIAGVSAEGVVTARAVGSVTIHATIEGQSGEADLAVIPRGYSGEWSSVSVATGRSCALAEGGAAYCWGQRLMPQPTPGADTVGTPTRVPGPQTFTQVRAAATIFNTQTCGLTSEGTAYCWGGNQSRSQFGTPVPGPALPTLTTLASDVNFVCGLAAGGGAYCWGPGLETGILDYDGRALPSLPGAQLTSLTVDYGMVCGIDTEGATVCQHRRFLTRWAPNPVADGFTTVAVGSGFRCGLRSDGEALCSTKAGVGTGGSWSMGYDLTPVRTPQPLVQLTAGGSQACGLAADGTAYCWKVDVGGGLGFGGRSDVTTPAAISGNHRFVQISATATHACGVTADGELYCWGDNGAGELGNGSIGGYSDAPVRVSDPA